MSDPPQSELDFWEFVACSRCQLPFVPEQGAPPNIPFWLTECGHVICNNHLNPDQSCALCGAQNIQVLPLQRELDPPMSEWFRSLPHALDGIANAVKFQHEVLCYQVRHYKTRYKQARELIDKIKHEMTENKMLKRSLEELRQQNEQLRQHLGFSDNSHQQVEDHPDASSLNKKRRLPEQHLSESSPRSATPIGPNRLTLPPGQPPPTLSSRRVGEDGHNPIHGADVEQQVPRPDSRRLIQQYAYAPLQPPNRLAPQTQHQAQSAPRRQLPPRMIRDQGRQPPPVVPSQASSSRFKPAQAIPSMNGPQGTGHANVGRPAPTPQHSYEDDRRRTEMGPPPVPRVQTPRVISHPLMEYDSNQAVQSFQQNAPGASMDSRFPLALNGQQPVPSTAGLQRFPPASAGSSAPQRFLPAAVPGSRAPSRSGNFNTSAAQRKPFMPNARFG